MSIIVEIFFSQNYSQRHTDGGENLDYFHYIWNMKLARIQDQIALEEAIINAVDDYANWSTEIDSKDGIHVAKDLAVSVVREGECPADDFFPIASLLRTEDGKTQADFERCAEVAQKYIFVR